MAHLGIVTRQQDGSYKGYLKTLSIKAPIQIIANDAKMPESNEPDYRIMSADVEVGAAWYRTSLQGNHYTSLKFAAPEFGQRVLNARLGRAAGQDDDDVFAIIWNPAD